MEHVFIKFEALAQGSSATEYYGPFSRKRAHMELENIGWALHHEFQDVEIWWPPDVKGKTTGARALIRPLFPELPRHIDVHYAEFLIVKR